MFPVYDQFKLANVVTKQSNKIWASRNCKTSIIAKQTFSAIFIHFPFQFKTL